MGILDLNLLAFLRSSYCTKRDGNLYIAVSWCHGVMVWVFCRIQLLGRYPGQVVITLYYASIKKYYMLHI
jgi:hypothetical protein